MKTRLIRTAALLGALALWWVGALANESIQWVPPAMIPAPPEILQAGWELRDVIPGDIAISLLRVIQGFAIAATLGVLLGCLCATSRIAENILDPIFDIVRPISAARVPAAFHYLVRSG